MLAQLSTVKSRLALTVPDYDDLLTNAIKAVSDRFERECNRRLPRTTDATHEFDPADTEILPPCYPIESVTKFELKSNETDGWTEQTNVQYLLRRQCVISLSSPLTSQPSTLNPSLALARVTYTGGYVLPGDPDPDYQPSTNNYPPTRLPADLEQAAVEQVAYWFRNREKTGLLRSWPSGGVYETFLQSDLLLEVRAVLKRHQRLVL